MGRQEARQGVEAIPSHILAWAWQIWSFQAPDTASRLKRTALAEKGRAVAVHKPFHAVSS